MLKKKKKEKRKTQKRSLGAIIRNPKEDYRGFNNLGQLQGDTSLLIHSFISFYLYMKKMFLREKYKR